MSNLKPSSPSPANSRDAATSWNGAEQRRYGRVVRDDRDQAIVEWVAPPKGWEKTQLSLAEDKPVTASGTIKGKGFDPYESGGGNGGVTWSTAPDRLKRPARTDLRKLSEHIKQMRTLQAESNKDEE